LTCFSGQGYVPCVAGLFEEHADSIASRVAAGLGQVGLAMKSQAWADACQRGLTPTQGQILTLLRSRAESGLRLSQVAESLGISPPTASDSVRALVRKGLVQKARAAGDARAIALELTRLGRTEAECTASWPDFLLCAIDTLSESEQEALFVGLIKIIGALVDRGSVPHQRMCLTCRYFHADAQPGRRPPHHCALLDAPLGTRQLRLDCAEHVSAAPEQARRNLATFAG
jgi:DNA-binding MarR family transcriptional regulator